MTEITMNGLVIGRRIPVGIAINSALTFGAYIYNIQYPEAAISVAAVGSLGVVLTALAQVAVVNIMGVTGAPTPQD